MQNNNICQNICLKSDYLLRRQYQQNHLNESSVSFIVARLLTRYYLKVLSVQFNPSCCKVIPVILHRPCLRSGAIILTGT